MNTGWLGALDALWRERRCRACARPYLPDHTASAVAAQLCPACAAHLAPYSGPVCRCCRLPLTAPTGPDALCGACLQEPPPWEHLHCYGLYEGQLKRLLLRFKFGQEHTLTPLLGAMLAASAAACLPCDVAVPMPQHPTRLRERGMNQAHELTRCATRALHLPLLPEALQRLRPTPPQVRLRAAERRRNPQGSFAAGHVRDCTVLLCDDTMTTGATLRHAALALRAAGAASVRVAVVARAPLRESPPQSA